MKNSSLQFDENGYLPSGWMDENLTFLEHNFVKQFPDSVTRSRIFDNYLQYTQRFEQEVYPYFEQWIDGSFITQKENPKDIDLVTFLDYRVYELRGETFMDRFWSFSLENEGIDAYIVKQYPQGHELFSAFMDVRNYYYKLFSTDRIDRSKGIIRLKFSK